MAYDSFVSCPEDGSAVQMDGFAREVVPPSRKAIGN
jgi:hypothetical protein